MDLSVAIPTCNRAGQLAGLLDSLAVQQEPGFAWEVLVVDNGSTDRTAEVAAERAQDFPAPLRLVAEPRPGLHQGRHSGAREARGTIVAYLDDDMELAPTWLRGALPILEDQAEAVGGRILPRYLDGAVPPAWVAHFYADCPYGRLCCYLGLLDYGDAVKPISPFYIFGGNAFLRRDLIFSLGGFHPDGMPAELMRLRGDGETALMQRFADAGLRAAYAPEATAYHLISPGRLTPEYFAKRAYAQGVSDAFTRVRAAGRVPDDTPPALSLPPPGDPAREIKTQVNAAYASGFAWYLAEVAADPALLAHALRDNFLDHKEARHAL
jgi:hypothetical protein